MMQLSIVDDDDFLPLSADTRDRNDFPFRPFLPQEHKDRFPRSSTPTLPPGLPLPQGHPAAAIFQDISSSQSPASSTSFPAHLPPGLPVSYRATPIQKSLESISLRQSSITKD